MIKHWKIAEMGRRLQGNCNGRGMADHGIKSGNKLCIHFASVTQCNDHIWVFLLLFCAWFSENEQMIRRSCPGEISSWSLCHKTRETPNQRKHKSYAGKSETRLLWDRQDQDQFFLSEQKTICLWRHHQWKWEIRNLFWLLQIPSILWKSISAMTKHLINVRNHSY